MADEGQHVHGNWQHESTASEGDSEFGQRQGCWCLLSVVIRSRDLAAETEAAD